MNVFQLPAIGRHAKSPQQRAQKQFYTMDTFQTEQNKSPRKKMTKSDIFCPPGMKFWSNGRDARCVNNGRGARARSPRQDNAASPRKRILFMPNEQRQQQRQSPRRSPYLPVKQEHDVVTSADKMKKRTEDELDKQVNRMIALISQFLAQDQGAGFQGNISSGFQSMATDNLPVGQNLDFGSGFQGGNFVPQQQQQQQAFVPQFLQQNLIPQMQNPVIKHEFENPMGIGMM